MLRILYYIVARRNRYAPLRFEAAYGHSGGVNMKLKVILEPSDEGGFTVYVPSLPGCISEGETATKALTNIRQAIKLYLEPVEDDLVMSEHAKVEEVEI